jgi:hypothetical protein
MTDPKKDPLWLTVSQMAQAFGVSTSALNRWPLKQSVKVGRSVYLYLPEAVEYRVGRAEKQQSRYSVAKTQLMESRAAAAKLDLAEREGRLANLDQVRAVWAELVAAARARFLAVPHRAPALVGLDEKEIFAILKDAVRDALDQLSRDGGTTAGGDGAEAREDRGAVSAPEANGGD